VSGPRTTPRSTASLAQRAIGDGLVVVVLGGWWLLSREMPTFLLPDPVDVGKSLIALFVTPSLLADTVTSAVRVVVAVVLSVFLGGALAILPYRWPIFDAIVHERIKPFLNSFPSTGWAILAMVWFGTSSASVVLVEVMILTPFCLVNIAEGLRELDVELVEMAGSFTRSRRRVLLKIIMPLLLPYTLSSVRIAYGVAWKIALVAELFGATSGLGYVMLKAQIVSDATTVLGTCFAIVALFLAGEKLVIDPLSRLVAYK
jgi:NitT/TauT family transport system permease protein/sulfonate transport system permease protein